MNAESILSMPAEQYHAAEGISNSQLRILAEKTPLHLWCHMHTPPEPPTPAQRMGTLVHRCLLEPDTVEGAFYVKPEGMSFATVDGKAWKKEHTDRPVVATEEEDQIRSMIKSVQSHPVAKKLFSLGKPEQSIFVKDEHGTLRKGRFDWLSESGNILPDLKTCESAAPDDFEKSIFDYGYFRQAAFYLDLCELIGLDKTAFAFVCVEKSAPYAVAVYNLLDDVIDAGRRLYHRDLQVYRNCVESGKWPGYGYGIASIGIPQWAMKRLELQ